MSPFTRRIQQAAIQLDQTADGRPTGPGYVRYEDLYQSGDSVTDAMNQLTSPAIVTFPEDLFLLNNFISYTKGGVMVTGAINCEASLCQGIIGSGRGTFGGSTGTIFQMVANSSTLGGSSYAPTQAQGGTTQVWMIRSVGAVGDMTFKNFQLVGTEQGHNYNGLYCFTPAGNITIQNVFVNGVPGDNGAPPGETFGISAYQGNLGHTIIDNCEVDGRRSIGGEWIGAGGITTGRSNGATITNSTAHHGRASSAFVFYRAFNGSVSNCVWGTTDTPQITTGTLPHCVNHEVASGILHNNCTYYAPSSKPHISFSNNHETVTLSGTTYSCVDGSLKVVNPVYNNAFGDNYLYIESWLTGVDGTTNDDSMVDPPLVTLPDGVTHKPYKWAHGTNQLIT